MSTDYKLSAEVRSDEGKGASRRLRRLQLKVPAIIYGGKKKPQSISLEERHLVKALENEAFYSHILTLEVEGKEEQVILRDLQRHPSKGIPMHADFQRVSATKKIHMQVPLHFINEDACTGVKLQGGIISHNANEVEISCLPKNLPEYLEVDMIDVEVGTTLHLSDVTLPKGVESVALSHGPDHDLPIVVVSIPKGSNEDDEAEAEASSEDSSEDAAE